MNPILRAVLTRGSPRRLLNRKASERSSKFVTHLLRKMVAHGSHRDDNIIIADLAWKKRDRQTENLTLRLGLRAIRSFTRESPVSFYHSRNRPLAPASRSLASFIV